MDCYEESPFKFKLNVVGTWKRTQIEVGNNLRIIGTFCADNNYTLTIDDNDDDQGIHKATMLILEPHILIPTTQIVKASSCTRSAYLSHHFKGQSGDINEALVYGNVIHAVF